MGGCGRRPSRWKHDLRDLHEIAHSNVTGSQGRLSTDSHSDAQHHTGSERVQLVQAVNDFTGHVVILQLDLLVRVLHRLAVSCEVFWLDAFDVSFHVFVVLGHFDRPVRL